jgi:hypothetical protein
MKLPNYLTQRLDYYGWVASPEHGWVRDGVQLIIEPSRTDKSNFLVQYKKMSDTVSKLISVDELDRVIRTATKP